MHSALCFRNGVQSAQRAKRHLHNSNQRHFTALAFSHSDGRSDCFSTVDTLEQGYFLDAQVHPCDSVVSPCVVGQLCIKGLGSTYKCQVRGMPPLPCHIKC